MAPPRRSFFSALVSNPYIAGALPTIGGIMFGCDISSMSGQLSNPYYLDYFNHPNSDLQGGINAAMPAGSFGGALINSWLSDKIGRKKCIILSGWIWVLGCALQAGAVNIAMLVTGRVIAGIAVGIASAIVTVYQAEITRPSIRGRIVSIQQLSIMSGIMLQYFVTFGCAEIDSNASFRLPWALQAIPGVVLGTFMFFFPESPRYLMDIGQEDSALQILGDIHAKGDTEDALVQFEFSEIKRQIDYEKTQAAKSYLDLIKPDVRRRVFLGCADQMWSQLSGMGVLVTIPAVIWLDKVGRRGTMFWGAVCMAFFLMLIGALQASYGHPIEDAAESETTTWVIEGNKSVSYAIIVFSYLFVCSFASTWGPCSWTYASEIFPTRVRGKAVSFATASNWVFNFALSYSTPPAFRDIQWKTYFLYMTFNCCAAIHVFFMFPETKGFTLEEMEEVFDGNAFTAWKAGKNVRRRAVEGDVEASPPAPASDLADEKADLKPHTSHVSHAALNGDEKQFVVA